MYWKIYVNQTQLQAEEEWLWGFWYFLMLLIGGWLVIRGLFKKNTSGLIRFGTLVIGGLLIALGLFMFQDGSDAIVADLFNLW